MKNRKYINKVLKRVTIMVIGMLHMSSMSMAMMTAVSKTGPIATKAVGSAVPGLVAAYQNNIGSNVNSDSGNPISASNSAAVVAAVQNSVVQSPFKSYPMYKQDTNSMTSTFKSPFGIASRYFSTSSSDVNAARIDNPTPADYALLGVTPTSTRDEVNAAFYAKIKEVHPDLNGTDNTTLEASKNLNGAHDRILAILPASTIRVDVGNKLAFGNVKGQLPTFTLPVTAEGLEQAVLTHSYDEVKNIIKVVPCDLKLFNEAIINSSSDIIRLLAKKNRAMINQRDDKKMSPLDYAAMYDRADAVEALIKEGANINSRSDVNNSLTPLHYAAQSNSLQSAQALISAGAELQNKNFHGSNNRGSYNYYNCGFRQYTPLYYAVQNGSLDMVQLLVNNGADVKIIYYAQDKNNSLGNKENCLGTILHIAAKNENGYGEGDILTFLIGKGVDVTVKDNNKKTAYDILYDEDHMNLCKIYDEAVKMRTQDVQQIAAPVTK